MNNPNSSILIIYTGGTIGMINDPKTGSLVPVDFTHIKNQVPEVNNFTFNIDSITFDKIIDSSNISPEIWIKLAKIIEKNYEKYDGFVILHGTDTMAYSASALSFLIENLEKPIVFTGSQLPIGTLRTDGKENFISAIEIAAAKKDGKPIVPEVCVFFENMLYRGNRTTKHSAEYFDAFRSHNYPELAKAGIHISYNTQAIQYNNSETIKTLKIHTQLNPNVATLRVFPGIQPSIIDAIMNIEGLKALVLETFGSGNAPTEKWFTEKIKKIVENKIIVLNVSQCNVGSVDMGLYETSLDLLNIGVISGRDITIEAAITKLMFLLGQNLTHSQVKKMLLKSLRGEIIC